MTVSPETDKSPLLLLLYPRTFEHLICSGRGVFAELLPKNPNDQG